MSATNKYNKKSSIEQLKEAYDAYKEHMRNLGTYRNQLAAYIHFLYTKEGYTQSELAELIGVTRQRIGQHIMSVENAIKKAQGGDNHA